MTKLQITIDLEVKDITDFDSSVEYAIVKFSQDTKSNILKVNVDEQ